MRPRQSHRINVRRSAPDRKPDQAFQTAHRSRSFDHTRRARRHLRFSWSKRSREVNHIAHVAGPGQTNIGHDQVSRERLDLGIPARTLARGRDHRITGVLRKSFRATQSATAGFVVWRSAKEARRAGARNRRLARTRERSSEGLFLRHAATPRNRAGAAADTRSHYSRRTYKRTRSTRNSTNARTDS